MKYLTLILSYLLITAGLYANAPVRSGAEQLDKWLPLVEGKRIALVANQTSLCGKAHLLDTLVALKRAPAMLMAPEHGFRGKMDAGATIKDGKDFRTGIPVVSLYGKNKKPTPAQLQSVDAIVFDLQDVGVRFYTYISTLYYVMQACAENGKPLIVLDRPNPCDYVDGPVLDLKFKSFVGMLPIPVLHGCTLGEIALMINGEGWLGCRKPCPLTVIRTEGWKHGMPYVLPVKPSPNLPTPQAIALYPSLCLFEATSVSVGRGTYFPFQVIGSPLLPSGRYPFSFTPKSISGFDTRPLHKDQVCYGVDLRKAKAPEGFSLKYFLEMYRSFKAMGKEHAFLTRPQWMDLLMGTRQVRMDVLQGKEEAAIRAAWEKDLEAYRKMRTRYLLYEDYPENN